MAKDEKDEEATVRNEEANETSVDSSDNSDGEAEEELQTATMLWFSKSKGYGFAVMDGEKEGENDILVHKKNLELDGDNNKPDLEKDDRVSFYLGDAPEGNAKDRPIAIEVKKMPESEKESGK